MGPWGPRRPWAEPGLWRFPLCRMDPLVMPLPAGCGPSAHTPKSGNSDPACFQNRLRPWTSQAMAPMDLAGWKCKPRLPEMCLFLKKGTGRH